MTRNEDSERTAARERQSYVRHELRAPLAVMYPVISLLLDDQEGTLTDDQRRLLEVLQRNAERLEARITSATESGWLDCAAVPTVLEDVSLDSVVDELLTQRRLRHLTRPRIAVSAGSPPPVARADRHHVRGILANLVANAGRQTPSRGEVRIRTGWAPDGSMAALSVEDDGPGMATEDAAIACRFGYEDDADDGARTGLGIGLWVSRELAGRNGGSLEVIAAPGRGTTVTLYLPAARAPG
jgi:two-component system, OmpR family, phosphate regulon sensor histidine kinase PhoR